MFSECYNRVDITQPDEPTALESIISDPPKII